MITKHALRERKGGRKEQWKGIGGDEGWGGDTGHKHMQENG